MEMPVADLYDRLSILILKLAHGVDVADEIRLYGTGFKIDSDFLDLIKANAEIWQLEAAIRNSENLSLEEIGRRAVCIRDKNKIRIAIKNTIASAHNQPTEKKIHHASEN